MKDPAPGYRIVGDVVICDAEDPPWPCWPYDRAPDHCFAPAPEPQEFRKGDWVRANLGDRVAYAKVQEPAWPDLIRLEDSRGVVWDRSATALELIERCPSTPTGPPVVGSYVCTLNRRNHGIVYKGSRPEGLTQEVLHVHWRTGGSSSHLRSELIHLCSPEGQ